MVTGIPEFNVEHEGVCLGHSEGKPTRGPFSSSNSKTSNILQLIHSDISGMMPVNSLGGYLYYLTFTNDYSCKTWIYFLENKDEVFTSFRHFKAMIENQSMNKIKILRTDNGTKTMNPMNSMIITEKLALRGRLQHHTLPSRMV